MPVKREKLEEVLKSAFPEAAIELIALTGDDDHWQVNMRSSRFEGKSRIEQHRIVTDVVNHLNIHALSIKTSI